MRLSLLAACLVSSLANAQSPLTNNDVIHMFAFGISPAIIKATINKSKAGFDLSPEGLIQLKKSGLNDDIVIAMLSKSNMVVSAPVRDSFYSLPSGIYYKSAGRHISFEPGFLTSRMPKGFGGLMRTFSSFIHANSQARIDSPHAKLRIAYPKPLFLFVSDNPDDFFLIRMRATDSSRQMNFEKPASGRG